MATGRLIDLKNTYKEALHCLLRLHVDAPLSLSELNFHRRLQLQVSKNEEMLRDFRRFLFKEICRDLHYGTFC